MGGRRLGFGRFIRRGKLRVSKPYLILAFTSLLVSSLPLRRRFVPFAHVFSLPMAKKRSEGRRQISGLKPPSRSAGGKSKRATPKGGARPGRAAPKSTGKWFPSVATEGDINGYKDNLSMPTDLKVRTPNGEVPPEPHANKHILCSGYFGRGSASLFIPSCVASCIFLDANSTIFRTTGFCISPISSLYVNVILG